jgi:hypothetical protein
MIQVIECWVRSPVLKKQRREGDRKKGREGRRGGREGKTKEKERKKERKRKEVHMQRLYPT